MQETETLSGKVILIRGDRRLVKRMCMSLAVKLQAIARPVFIDAGNMFDPYAIQKISGKKAKEALSAILISRPFTMHQLKTLVFNLPEVCHDRKAVIISSVDALFSEGTRESSFVLEQTLSQLQLLTKRHNLITILGSTGDVHYSLLEQHVDAMYIL